MAITEAVNAAISKMDEAMKERLSKMGKDMANTRTGRANPMMLESVKVEAYGTLVPLKQVAAVSVPEARTLEIRPWDPSTLTDIEKALQKADVGAMPQSDGKMLRINLPMMTADRRKDLVKVVKTMAEEGRVTIRNLRRAARHELDQLSSDTPEDELTRAEKELDKLTHAQEAQIDRALEQKEQELLEV